MSVQLRDYQLKAIKELHEAKAAGLNTCVVSPTGCHAAGTKVMLANLKTKAVEDVQVGDKLLGVNGHVRTVLRLCRGTGRMYQIKYNYGHTLTVNEDHILSLKIDREDTANMSVKDYLSLPEEMKDRYTLYSAPPSELPVPHIPLKNLPLHPFILGQILSEYDFTIDGTPIHKPVKEYFETTKPVGDFDYDMLNTLGQLGVRKPMQWVHIPKLYLHGSLETRRELMSGMLRHRGKIQSKTRVQDVTLPLSMREDFMFLAHSLGFRVSVRKNRLQIQGDCSQLPAHRMMHIAKPTYRYRGRFTFKIEYIGQSEFYGFELDGDHLYLLDDWIVTHNSGKTLIIKQFVDELLKANPSEKIAVVTHRLEILNNLKQTLDNDLVDFATVQKLSKTDKVYDTLIVDECHHVVAKTYRKMIRENCRWHCGFTATPLRGYMPEYSAGTPVLTKSWMVELHGILGEDLYDKAITTIDTAKLIEDHYLSNYEIVHDYPFHIRHHGSKMIDFTKREVDDSITVEECVDYIYSTLDKKQGIVFCHAIDFAKRLSQTLGEEMAVLITSKTSKNEREECFERFKQGKVKLLVSVDIFSEGVDVPSVDCVYLFRPTRSLPVYLQQIGRALRPSPGKEKAVVYDYVNNFDRLGTEPKLVTLKDMLLDSALTYEYCRVCKARGVVEGIGNPKCGPIPPPEAVIIRKWLKRNVGKYEWIQTQKDLGNTLRFELNPDAELSFDDLVEYMEYIDGKVFPVHIFAVIKNIFGNWELQTPDNVARATEFKTSVCIEMVGTCKHSDRKHLYYLITESILADVSKRLTPRIKHF